jgi:hypothetical protein
MINNVLDAIQGDALISLIADAGDYHQFEQKPNSFVTSSPLDGCHLQSFGDYPHYTWTMTPGPYWNSADAYITPGQGISGTITQSHLGPVLNGWTLEFQMLAVQSSSDLSFFITDDVDAPFVAPESAVYIHVRWDLQNVMCSHYDAGDVSVSNTLSVNLPLSTWIHFVATASPTGLINLYLNGLLLHSVSSGVILTHLDKMRVRCHNNSGTQESPYIRELAYYDSVVYTGAFTLTDTQTRWSRNSGTPNYTS